MSGGIIGRSAQFGAELADQGPDMAPRTWQRHSTVPIQTQGSQHAVAKLSLSNGSGAIGCSSGESPRELLMEFRSAV